jgi:quercetin dioxygenase-like cupin family protein
MTAAAVALLAAPAGAKNTTPPGVCAVSYPQTAIPSDPNESAYGVDMTIRSGRTGNWHKHDAVEYLTVTSGSGTLEILGKKPVTLVVGKTVMIPANVEHRVHDGSASSPIAWSGIFIGSAAKSTRVKLTEGETAWTPGCPH